MKKIFKAITAIVTAASMLAAATVNASAEIIITEKTTGFS